MRHVTIIAVIASSCYFAGCSDASVPEPSAPPSMPVVESSPVVDPSPTTAASLDQPEGEYALNQTASSTDSESAYVDQKIALTFPRSVAGLNFAAHNPYPQAGLGYSIRYENEDVMKVDIYVYDMGRSDISSGHTGEDIIRELRNAEAGIRLYEKRGAYRDVKKLGGGVYPASATDSDVAFQSSRYQYSQSARPGVTFTGLRASETFITGFKGHFIKIRVTYPQKSAKESMKTRDQFIQQLTVMIAAP